MNLIGKVFYTRPHIEVTVLQLHRPDLYIVQEKDIFNERDTRTDILLTTEQIIQELQPERQAEIKQHIEKAFIWRNEQEKKTKEREAQEEQKRLELEFTHGYTDRMTPMQKGKILQILNKVISTDIYGRQRRKDYIVSCIQDGREFRIEKDVRRCTKHGDVKTVPIEYQIHFTITNPDGTAEKYYQTITKTEYDYAAYLVVTDKVQVRRPQATDRQTDSY